MTEEEKQILKDVRRKKWQAYYEKHRNEYLMRKKAVRDADPEAYKAKAKVFRDKRKDQKTEYERRHTSDYHARIKVEVLAEYGWCCTICGESHVECLTIDHSKNDGAEFRKLMKQPRYFAGIRFYKWLKAQGFPQDLGLRVLCFNCNCSIGAYGYSPYEVEHLWVIGRSSGPYAKICHKMGE